MLKVLLTCLFAFILASRSEVLNFDWNSGEGDGKWTDERWSQLGFPNSTDHRARIDVAFSIGEVLLEEQVKVSRLVIGPGCARVQITEVPGELTKLTVETNPMDVAKVELSGTIIEQPISISLYDPLVAGRVAMVDLTTELNDEMKHFELTRSSTASGWFFGTFPTRNGAACPEDPTTLCIDQPQEIFVTYLDTLDHKPIRDRIALGCGDFADFKVEEVEWALTGKAVSANLGKLWDIYMRLLEVKTTLSEKDYVDNLNDYKEIAEQSFVLGSTCLEEFCESSHDFLQELCNEGGTVPLGHNIPLTRIINEEEEF